MEGCESLKGHLSGSKNVFKMHLMFINKAEDGKNVLGYNLSVLKPSPCRIPLERHLTFHGPDRSGAPMVFHAFRPKTRDKTTYCSQIGRDRERDVKGVTGPCAELYEYPGEDADAASQAIEGATVRKTQSYRRELPCTRSSCREYPVPYCN